MGKPHKYKNPILELSCHGTVNNDLARISHKKAIMFISS
jgi:hypothetical protein